MKAEAKESVSFNWENLGIQEEEIKIQEADYSSVSANLHSFYTRNFSLPQNTIMDLTVSGLPANCRHLYVTPMERIGDGRPNNGDVMFMLVSAALSPDGTKARVRFKHSGRNSMPCGVSMIFG